MTARGSRRIAPLALVFALALTAGVARADGPQTPFVVARGHSLHGAPWQIKFGEERGHGSEPDYAIFDFEVGTSAEQRRCGCGYYSAVPLPLPPTFNFDGTLGSEFDRFPEADLSGTAGPRVKRLALKLSDGSVVDARPLRAPRRLLQRFPRLRPFRFFDLFFPDSLDPVTVSAYGRHGKLLERHSFRDR